METGPAHGTADGLGLRTEHGPGDFHLGNVVAPRHRVVHLTPEGAEPLFRRDPTARRGYHVTCMIRCDAFREQKRGAVRGGAPSPIAAYDIVNTAAAQFLATGPAWEIPSLSETRRAARELGKAAAASLEVGGKKKRKR